MAAENSVENFDLLNEIGKNGVYHLLFPPQQAGLAMLELYTKRKLGAFPGGKFREKDIYEALENSKFFISPGEYDRLPQLKFNSMISDLQTYFLRYDQDEQFYSFKDYADAFCKHAEETLLANFNPTQIELICNTLRERLEGCADEQAVDQWIQTFFYSFQPRMKSQVDQLERQIDQSVQEIRATTQLEDTSLIDMLKAIDFKLDTIRDQNTELRSAFREMKTINRLLTQQLDMVGDAGIIDRIAEVRQFFPEIRYTLNLIDKRLDRIQPKLRQFFGMLNKPTFNVKVEKLLKFLLFRSKVLRDKSIELPAGLPTFQLGQPTANFTIVERKNDLFPASPRPRGLHAEPPAETEAGFVQVKNHLRLYSYTEVYVQQILTDARLANVLFSTYFFQIINDKNDLELAARVAYALIKLAAIDPKLKLETSTNRVGHPNFPNLFIWEMKIYYQG